MICEGLPLEISNFMHYTRSLRFEDRPDYLGIRSLFKKLMVKEGYEYDHMFDWVMVSSEHMTSKVFSVESFDEIRMQGDKRKDAEDEERKQSTPNEQTK